jgi:type I restriction enzyme, S subunit
VPDFKPEVPVSWKLLTIADAMSAIIDYRGKSPRKTQAGVPLITAKIVKAGRVEEPREFIAVDDYEKWMRRGIPEEGDVVMTTEAPLGEIAQLDDRKVALAQRLITLRGKSGILVNTFLKFAMQSEFVQNQLKARATGTTVLGIRQSELRKVLLPIPPLEEQCAIGQLLGALDQKMEINRRMIETLEAIGRALFQFWFLNPEYYVNWQHRTLSESCEFIMSGGTPSTAVAAYWDGEIPWLSSGETRNHFICRTDKSITQAGVENSSTRFARRGCTVIASAGQGHTRGQTSLLMIDSYVNQSVVALAANQHVISDLYLYFDLERRYEQFRQMSDSQSSRGSLTTRLLANLNVIVPPRELIKEFDENVRPLVNRIRVALEENVCLSGLRDILLPKLLSGEIRLKDAREIVEANA